MQAVDGEVAAQDVLARIGFEAHRGRAAAIGVVAIAAEGGDLHAGAVAAHQHHAEMRAHAPGAREQLQQALGRRVGGHVEILGLGAQQQIAHTTAHQPSLVAGLAERGDDVASQGFR